MTPASSTRSTSTSMSDLLTPIIVIVLLLGLLGMFLPPDPESQRHSTSGGSGYGPRED